MAEFESSLGTSLLPLPFFSLPTGEREKGEKGEGDKKAPSVGRTHWLSLFSHFMLEANPMLFSGAATQFLFTSGNFHLSTLEEQGANLEQGREERVTGLKYRSKGEGGE